MVYVIHKKTTKGNPIARIISGENKGMTYLFANKKTANKAIMLTSKGKNKQAEKLSIGLSY